MSHSFRLTASEVDSHQIPMMERAPLKNPATFGSFPAAPGYHSVIEQVSTLFLLSLSSLNSSLHGHLSPPTFCHSSIAINSQLVLVNLTSLNPFPKQENREGSQRVASITAAYPGPSHSVAMMTSSVSSDEDMLDITTTGTTQVRLGLFNS